MINHWDSNNFSRLFESFRHTDVLITRGWISARVIVDHQDAIRGVSNRWPKHFTWMDQTVPQCPHGDLVTVDRHVLCVEADHPEFFLLALSGQPLKAQYSISIAKKAAAADSVALAQLGNSKAFALGVASFLADLVAAGVAFSSFRTSSAETSSRLALLLIATGDGFGRLAKVRPEVRKVWNQLRFKRPLENRSDSLDLVCCTFSTLRIRKRRIVR